MRSPNWGAGALRCRQPVVKETTQSTVSKRAGRQFKEQSRLPVSKAFLQIKTPPCRADGRRSIQVNGYRQLQRLGSGRLLREARTGRVRLCSKAHRVNRKAAPTAHGIVNFHSTRDYRALASTSVMSSGCSLAPIQSSTAAVTSSVIRASGSPAPVRRALPPRIRRSHFPARSRHR